MSSAKLQLNHPLPAPVVHAGFSIHQSKSHVLAGVQDAYWSDDEAEDAECPLCMDELDITDLNFKPCMCGYQICRFCWHHILENLNGRCPACRREYSHEAVEFKAIPPEDHKRLMQQKKQRERERKELDNMGRRHLANYRVVQRNVVYVVGIGPKFAKEELMPTLRSHEYFGQYGKISKIVIVKRTASGGAPVVGLYITYHRREDAARCIAAVDGSPAPGSSNRSDVMRASYGTTKYCMAFLRGVSCSDHNCMNLHEWGDEKDCFTKEDLTTLKHTMKATESKSRSTERGGEGLPKAASWAQMWAQKGPGQSTLHSSSTQLSSASSSRPLRRPASGARQTARGHVSSGSGDSRPSGSRALSERTKPTATKTPSQASSSRPPTPAPAGLPPRPATPSEAKPLRPKETAPPQPAVSPAPSTSAGSDFGSSEVVASPAVPPRSAVQSPPAPPATPAIPPGIPIVPPGLSAPPGLPTPNRQPKNELPQSQTPILAAQTTYQMSNAARALLDDMKTRRDAAAAPVTSSPFPDLDNLLQTLSRVDNSGGFSFNLDPSLAVNETDDNQPLPDFEAEATIPFRGTYLDAFPALRTPSGASSFNPPPGLPSPHNPDRAIFDPSMRGSPVGSADRPSTSSSYTGSFNPFADSNDDAASFASPVGRSQLSPLDDGSRQVSRFGFARGRQGSTTASSPLHTTSPISNNINPSPFPSTQPIHSQDASKHMWMPQAGPFVHSTSQPSLFAAHAQQAAMPQQPSRFQPFDNPVSEAQLRELIQSSQRMNLAKQASMDLASLKMPPQPQFYDPAIMSAKFSSQMHDANYMQPPPPTSHLAQMSYGPPPGLSAVTTMLQPTNHAVNNMMDSNGMIIAFTTLTGALFVAVILCDLAPVSPPPILSPTDFPALSASPVRSPVAENNPTSDETPSTPAATPSAKVDKKAVKKAAAAEKAAERRKLAEEKAAARAVEKARIAQEKAVEKEKAAALKAQQEKEQAEKGRIQKEKERLEKEQAERLKAQKLEKVKIAKEEAAKAVKEKAAKLVKAKVADSASSDQKAGSTPIEREKDKRPSSKTPAVKQSEIPKVLTRSDTASSVSISSSRQGQSDAPTTTDFIQPLLSKKPKKNKPAPKPVIRVPKEEDQLLDTSSTHSSAAVHPEPTYLPLNRGSAMDSSSTSRAQSVDRDTRHPASLKELLEDLHLSSPHLDLPSHPFFDTASVSPTSKMPLEYAPLVHALSALSVGGNNLANNVPSGSIDNAVSSFQQLLETLTQTISDLLRLLPRTTWDDSSSFDGVLRDMLKGDDFLDEGGEDAAGKEDEVAALTMALERRARWMEVQLSKLEELHRDINNAAVRAVLSFNDSGWDRRSALPKSGNSLKRFDSIGIIKENGVTRPLTVDELERSLSVAKAELTVANAELQKAMAKTQEIRPEGDDVF